jgi:hypothetical protein
MIRIVHQLQGEGTAVVALTIYDESTNSSRAAQVEAFKHLRRN